MKKIGYAIYSKKEKEYCDFPQITSKGILSFKYKIDAVEHIVFLNDNNRDNYEIHTLFHNVELINRACIKKIGYAIYIEQYKKYHTVLQIGTRGILSFKYKKYAIEYMNRYLSKNDKYGIHALEVINMTGYII